MKKKGHGSLFWTIGMILAGIGAATDCDHIGWLNIVFIFTGLALMGLVQWATTESKAGKSMKNKKPSEQMQTTKNT